MVIYKDIGCENCGTKEKEAVSISCDNCKSIYLFSGDFYVQCKIDNFVNIKKNFSYGSKNDGETHYWNFCEDCAFELLGPASRVVEHD